MNKKEINKPDSQTDLSIDPQRFMPVERSLKVKENETKEEILYRFISSGFAGNEILAEFQDTEELVDVALRLCIKRCVQIVFEKDVSPMHQVGTTRLLAQIRYKGLSEGDDEGSGTGGDISGGMRKKDIDTIRSAVGKLKK